MLSRTLVFKNQSSRIRALAVCNRCNLANSPRSFVLSNTMLTAHATTTDLCDKVRTSCRKFIEESGGRHVQVLTNNSNDDTITPMQTLVDKIISHNAGNINWDDEGWHYQGYEYEDISTTLTAIASLDHYKNNGDDLSLENYALSPHRLATMTAEQMQDLFVANHKKGLFPPNIEQRVLLWNEVGHVLLDKYDGSAMQMIKSAQNSAPKLVDVVYQNFAGFRDVAEYKSTDNTTSTPIYFLKRAQILVGDLNAALKLDLQDIDALTTFADYRVPQLLRHLNIIQYDDELQSMVDDNKVIEQGSIQELSIRAATVVAVDDIVAVLKNKQTDRSWTAVQVDWYLWQIGEKMNDNGEMKPHHKVETTYY